MKLRYKCLILDHDDTITNSAVETNYPNMLDSLAILRPGEEKKLTLEEFLLGTFHGYQTWVQQRYGYTAAELEWQYPFWKEAVMKNRPSFVAGMADFLARFRRAGGVICVATHSYRVMIETDFRKNCGFLPDYLNCWDDPVEHRKPFVFPVEEALRRFGVEKRDILVVDDMLPGCQMANAAGVDFAAAFWCHDLAPLREYMNTHAQYQLKTVAQLEALVFGQGAEATGESL